MAGYIVKIMIEDTHPPVWRRVIVPEKITFANMHEIIQILFDWEDMHLHNFTIPPKYITIDDEDGFGGNYHYSEDSTLLEQFLLTNKWIRYTYDFGDEWRHRIIYEKTDESYEKRHATLVKSRGDNFEEDCGGIWSEEEYLNRKPFDSISAGLRLSALSFPAREGNQNMEDSEWLEGKELEKFFQDLADKFMQNMEKALQHKETAIKDSRMREKAEKWDKFIEIWHAQMCVHKEDDGYVQMTIPGIFTEEPFSGETMQKEHTLEIVSGNKTQKQLLADLNIAEAADYCKYLRIPLDNIQELKQMNDEIADILKSNPEYILYVMDETEYQELLEWLKLPLGKTKQVLAETDTIFKATALGLADFSMQKIKGYQRAKLSFASDIQEILSALDKKCRKKTYKEINTFTERMQALLLAYGVVEIEKLRELYIKIYREETERDHFLRLLYWHARFTEKLHTFYFLDGTGYASLMDIDATAVLKKMDEFVGEQEYVLLSAGELKKFADDIWADNDWKSIVYSILYYHSDAPKEILEKAFGKMLLSVFNGETLQEVLKPAFDLRILKEFQLPDICEIWTSVSGMMLEQRLPMLKGRSRMGYAEEKDISPWQVGMVSDENMQGDFNTGPMCGFPAEIQDMMYQAVSFVDRNAMRELLRYKNRNHVRSEEFLYLLAEAYVTGGDNKKAERLIRELEESSERGKTAAGELRERLEYGEDIWDDYEDVYHDDNLTFGGEDLLQGAPFRSVWDYDQELQQTPYVRESPKIGRNAPCPCGSGKKYKKCCGKR